MFLEAAIFDPIRTAATARKLNIISDARYRFERGLDATSPFGGPRWQLDLFLMFVRRSQRAGCLW